MATKVLSRQNATKTQRFNDSTKKIPKSSKFSSTIVAFFAKLIHPKKKNKVITSGWHDMKFPPKPLPQYCSNLVVIKEKFVQFREETRKSIHYLQKKRNRNVILVYESRFGKDFVIQGIAQKFRNKRLISFDIAELKTKGNKEIIKIVTNTIRALADFDEDVVVFIDDIDFVFEGSTRESISRCFKPQLVGTKVQCVGATTLGDFRMYTEKDRVIEDLFEHVFVLESSVTETAEILGDLKAMLETKHRVLVEDNTLVLAVELSRRYLTEQRLPDKAISVVDRACEVVSGRLHDIPQEIPSLEREIVQLESELVYLKEEEACEASERLSDLRLRLKQQLAWHKSDQTIIEKIRKLIKDRKLDKEAILEEGVSERIMEKLMVKPEHVREVVSNLTGIPTQILSSTAEDKLCALGDGLRRKVLGQDQAITSVESAIRSIFKLDHRGYPYASFLFVGRPDVGQLETAKALAEELFGDAKFLLHFDMSEYKHGKDNLEKILAAKVREKQYCVLLFDNIEMGIETSTEVVTKLLSSGSLIDSENRKINFSNTVIIMISREGTDGLESTFLNRLDEIVMFDFPSRVKIAFDEAPGEKVEEMWRPLRLNDDEAPVEKVEEMWRPLRLNDKVPIYDSPLNEESEDDLDGYCSAASEPCEEFEDNNNM